MAGQVQFDASKSDDAFLKVSKRQLDLIFNKEEYSDLTLVSEDNEQYYARWSILQHRWLWLGGLEDAEQVRNVDKGDKKKLQIPISGKMLFTILKWAYYQPVDLTGWTFDELQVFIGKCKEFILPELGDVAMKPAKKVAMEGNVEPAAIGRIFEYATELGDEGLIQKVVQTGIDQMEAAVSSREFSLFPAKLVAKMAEGLKKDQYPLFMRGIPEWSARRSSEEMYIVMSKIDLSVLPEGLVRKVMSNWAWTSEEVRVQLEGWTIVEKKNECPAEEELILKADHVRNFYAQGSRSSADDLFSTCRLFQSKGDFYFYLNNEVKCRKVSWNCRKGHVIRFRIKDLHWRDVDVDFLANSATFSAQRVGFIWFDTTEGALINDVRLTLASN